MHELSIALSIIDCAVEEAARLPDGGPVVAVHLKLGPLAGVIPEALLSAYEVAREGTALAGSRLVIEAAPLVVYCPRCRAERTPPSVQEIRCPECGTPTPEVRGGRELEIVALEVQE